MVDAAIAVAGGKQEGRKSGEHTDTTRRARRGDALVRGQVARVAGPAHALPSDGRSVHGPGAGAPAVLALALSSRPARTIGTTAVRRGSRRCEAPGQVVGIDGERHTGGE